MKKVWGLLSIAMLLISAVGTAYAQGVGPVDAWVYSWNRFSIPPATDSVKGTDTWTGMRSWAIGMSSHSAVTTFTHPTIAITNSPFSSFQAQVIVQPDGPSSSGMIPVTFPYSLTLPSLPPETGNNISLGEPTDVMQQLTPGFSISRTVSPLVVPANSTITQTIVITMTPTDPGRQPSSMGPGIGAPCLNTVPQADQCDSRGVRWWVSNPVVGQTYTFTAQISVENNNPFPVISKPWQTSQIGVEFGAPFGETGTSAELTDPAIGKVTFSLDQPVEWHLRPLGQTWIVDFPPLLENAGTGTGPLNGVIMDGVRFHATQDVMLASSPATGARSWSFQIANQSAQDGNPTFFTSPSITLTSPLYQSVTGTFVNLPSGAGSQTTTNLPFVYSGSLLGPGDSWGFSFADTDKTVTMAPGFDSSVSVAPDLVPAGETVAQTVTVKIKPVDGSRGTIAVLQGGITGNCSNIVSSDFTTTLQCDQNGVYFWQNWPTLNQEYAITAVLQTANTTSQTRRMKPVISTQMIPTQMTPPIITNGNTVSASDPAIGTATFTIDQSAQWYTSPSPQTNYVMDFAGVNQVVTDTTPPTIVPVLVGTAGTNPWFVGPVKVSWQVADPESGVASTQGCNSLTISSDTLGVPLTCSATNSAGLSSSQAITVKIDQTPPVISYTGNSGSYTVDQSVAIHCTASDATSGLASSTCANISGPAYSFKAGTNTYFASAQDNAGNTATTMTSFNVVVNSGGLCNLAQSFVTNRGIANSLCVKLTNAAAAAARGDLKAKAGLVGAFDNEVSAQSGKALTSAQAAILVRLAASL